ncbi:MAG TPA: hypothetical protein ENK46_11140 [Flavobacteriia bacterium]|nr:hypothetical protein [Flavobacteriia bacterium]
MKTLKKQYRFIALLFMVLTLSQSCRVYQQKSVTIEEAVKEQKRVKIKMKDKKVYKFKRIEYEKSVFFGIKKVKGKIVKIPIDVNEIEKLRLHNKTLSIIYGIGVTVVAVYVVAIIIVMATFDLNFGSSDFQFPN